VAEALDDVVPKGHVRDHHRHQGARRFDFMHTFTIDHHRHRLAAHRFGRLEADRLANDAGKKRVERAPRIGGFAAGDEAVLRVELSDSVPPKADQPAVAVYEGAGPGVQLRVNLVGGNSDGLPDRLQRDGLTTQPDSPRLLRPALPCMMDKHPPLKIQTRSCGLT
jgi:hypothetical protein